MSSKLLVLGHVVGNFSSAFTKLATLHAKNQFAFCIATGNLFSEADDDELDALLAGRVRVPVTTYFTVGTRPFPPRIAALLDADASADVDNSEVCPNLHYLGHRSVTKTASGLRIVALGGRLAEAGEADPNKPNKADAFHTPADEAALRGAHGADILLTAIWPRGITRGSRALPAGTPDSPDLPETLKSLETEAGASDGIAQLVAALRPRYHLTASPDRADGQSFFYEREAFLHSARPDQTDAVDVTRFISLARWGNTGKAKSVYAFALPTARPTTAPAGCTPSPFVDGRKKARKAESNQSFSRFASTPDGQRHDRHDRPDRNGRGKRRRMASPTGPARCFFCLSNPNLPTHMVACIGDDAYVAAAKGPLPEPTTFAAAGLVDTTTNTPFPGHMLIVPLSHAPTVAAAGDGNDKAAGARTYTEMTRFRTALQAMVAGVSKQSKQRLGAVTWEISRQRNVHVHWQFVPVPAELATGGLVEAAVRVEAANMQLPGLEEAAADETTIAGDYFRVWIWAEDSNNKTVDKTLVMRLDPEARFDVQFGRRVVAKLLGLEATRTVWQECAQTEAEETADVAAFRGAFKPWDFTLE